MIDGEANARLQALERQVARMTATQPDRGRPAPAPTPKPDGNPEEFALEHIAAVKDRLKGYRKEGETVLTAVSRLVAEVKDSRSKSKLRSH